MSVPSIAVIGCGYWGKNLVRNFHVLGSLKTVCDASPESRAFVQATYPGVTVTDSFESVLADPGIDGVVLATPAARHAEMAEAVMRAGKDVFVEKPLALHYREGETVVRTARETGRILMVGHLLEYHPAISKLRELVTSGALGDVRYVYSNRLNLGRIRREENILWSFAPHDVFCALRLVGDMPLVVTATGGAYLQPNIADVTVTNFLFEGGVRAHIFVSWLHPYKEHRLVVIGSEKMAVFDDIAAQKLTLYDQRVDVVNGEPVIHKGLAQPIDYPAVEPLAEECRHFLECIETRQRPRTDGVNALQVLYVLQACHRSLQTNGEPVHLGMPSFEVSNV